LGAGKVNPSAQDPTVSVVRVSTTKETKEVIAAGGRETLNPVEESIAGVLKESDGDGPEARGEILGVLERHRIPSAIDDIHVVSRDVYGLVKSVSDKFEMKVPKMVIMNTPMQNAAATGVSSSRSTITITAGALEELNDDELRSVVGHELGHVEGHDPLFLFGVTMVMYFGGLFIWLPILLDLGIFYFLVAFVVIYSIGKVLETRADTQSASRLGNPEVLAEALSEIGYVEIFREKYSRAARVLDWLRLDSHPPTYFRVDRLSKLASNGRTVKHALAVSARDCVLGFLRALA
ncbi:MAG TPA: M48 family metalloprotease, partial [Nitrososphaerales archaeon]|nr:M48 family metalloprotease [Nitrososphaerales archaeon]